MVFLFRTCARGSVRQRTVIQKRQRSTASTEREIARTLRSKSPSALASQSASLPITRSPMHRSSSVRLRFFNSLRRVGERAPLFVVDCGLTATQREQLSTRATIVPPLLDLHPMLQKATGPLTHPSKIMVFVDADILVTRPLNPLLEDAAAGRIVVFEDSGHPNRFSQHWSTFGLGVVHRRPYVNSGFFATSWDTASSLLPALVELQRHIDLSVTVVSGIGCGLRSALPLYSEAPHVPRAVASALLPDQDLLNVLLCTRFDDRVTRVERKLAPFPPFAGLGITARDHTLCSYADGTLRSCCTTLTASQGSRQSRSGVYSQLFTMLVTDQRACLTLDRRDLPLRLTNHTLAPVDRWRASKQHAMHNRVRGRLHIRPRPARLRVSVGGGSVRASCVGSAGSGSGSSSGRWSQDL